MRPEALGSELAIQALDEGIARRLAGAREAELDAFEAGPEIKVLRDELRALVDPDGLRSACLGIAKLGTDTLKHLDDVKRAVERTTRPYSDFKIFSIEL